MKLFTICLAVAPFLFSALPAHAASSNRNYCISKCFATWNCVDDSGRLSCEGDRNRCVQDCGDIPDDPAHVSGGPYGAIAYDKKSGAWGLADESPNRGEAKKSARRYCEQGGGDCDIVDTFKNTCAAIAVGADGAVGWSDNDNVKQAGLDAIKDCGKRAKSGTRCFLKLWHCYSE